MNDKASMANKDSGAVADDLVRWSDVGAALTQRFDREYWQEQVDQRRFPTEVWSELGAGGNLGILVDQEHGGAGGGLRELAALVEGLGAAGFPMLSLITSPGLAIPAIAQAAAPAMRATLLPSLLAGTSMVAFAVTEAGAGSNIMNVATKADVVGDTIVVNGAKIFTTSADVAGHIMVVARTPDPDRGWLGFTVVLVPRDADGLTIEPAPTRIAAAESQSMLTFDDVTLPLDHVVGAPAGGLHVLAPALAVERVLAGALAVGVGQFSLDVGASRARERQLHDRPIGAYQGVQHPLAEAAVAVAGARHLVGDAARAFDVGQADVLGLAEMACFGATDAGFRAADAGLQTLGGSGYTASGELHSMLQLARLLRSAPVNAQSSLNSIAELVLNLPRSY